jgi:hypothetical protein
MQSSRPKFGSNSDHFASKIDILDTKQMKDGCSGQSYETVRVRAQGNLIRAPGTVNQLEFRESVKFRSSSSSSETPSSCQQPPSVRRFGFHVLGNTF